ncbi:MAG TPA: hypothetical protein VIG94_06905 [Faecalibacter sp.]
MIKAEPKSILRFLHQHYDFLKELFDVQCNEGFISMEIFQRKLEAYDVMIEHQLQDFAILIDQNGVYYWNETYYQLFEFIHQEFKPLLPEEIESYYQLLSGILIKLKGFSHQDKNLTLNQIDALKKQLLKFRNTLQNNTKSLLAETQKIKANLANLTYHEKIKSASFLIDHYIVPLNQMLDVQHSQSIYQLFLSISKYSNLRRLDYSHESLRNEFEKLYHLTSELIKDLAHESKIITNELIPFLERIKTESEYLKGFYMYLNQGNCYKSIQPPFLPKKWNNIVYNPSIYEETKEYFDQFVEEEDLFIQEETSPTKHWFFNKENFLLKLQSELPILNFFEWCLEKIAQEKADFTLDDYFLLTGLMYENTLEIEHIEGDVQIFINEIELKVPHFQIK